MLNNCEAIGGIVDGFAVVIKTQVKLVGEAYLSGSQYYLVLSMSYLQPTNQPTKNLFSEFS